MGSVTMVFRRSNLPIAVLVRMAALLAIVAGCGRFGTAIVDLSESDPPVLSAAVGARVKVGMSQEEVLAVLRDAATGTPSAQSSLEEAVTQGRWYGSRYDMTVTQGKRELVLTFRGGKLVEKKQERLE
jgi:hypothetical protein